MKKILIVHPEGNINNNPNLFAIAELLINNHFFIDILAKSNNSINQNSYIKNLNFFFYTNNNNLDHFDCKNYSLIIGVDKGIIAASKFSKELKIPCFFISYEISFSDEIGLENKKEEIQACKNILFAICQDQIRSYFLSREYKIDLKKIFNVPISNSCKKQFFKSYFLYDYLNIPKNKKIALFAGSVSKWAMIEELIIRSDSWPTNWVLVIHDRYCRDSEFLSKLKKNRSHVYISNLQINTPNDLEKLICSADSGIGLYWSNFSSVWEGKNLTFLGLSSGKLITFLQYGIPLITNEIGQLSDIIRENKLGIVVSSISEINPAEIDSIPNCRNNCMSFFKEYLNFDLKADQLLELIRDSIMTNNIEKTKITSFNKNLITNYSHSHIKQIEFYFNLARKLENSFFFQLGHLLCNPHLLLNRATLGRIIKSLKRSSY